MGRMSDRSMFNQLHPSRWFRPLLPHSLFGQAFMPKAVSCNQRFLNLPATAINSGEQRNPISETPVLRQLSGNISRNLVSFVIGMMLPELFSILRLLAGTYPSSTKGRPVLAQQLHLQPS